MIVRVMMIMFVPASQLVDVFVKTLNVVVVRLLRFAQGVLVANDRYPVAAQ